MIAVEEMIEQLSVLIKECDDFRPFPPPESVYKLHGLSSSPASRAKRERGGQLQYRLQAAIDRCTTPDDSYRKDLNVARDSAGIVAPGIAVSGIASSESLLPIVKALCADLEDGWVQVE